MSDFLTKICGQQFWVCFILINISNKKVIFYKKKNFSVLKNPNFIFDKNPDLTFCFQNTLLVWSPCVVLWTLLPFWCYMLTRKRPFKIKMNWLLICKSVSSIF
jgi:hypothetical protein